ncbi:gamma DNA-directed DNA polymerase [Daedaleopsis nitida]|nr:gamma DNA-directed DNA polymerase [Daedaleopsis nitida]
MLRKLQSTTSTNATRSLHVSSSSSLPALKYKTRQSKQNTREAPKRKSFADEREEEEVYEGAETQAEGSGTKRNEVGVQLLSRKLHEQIFRNVSFPPAPKPYVAIAQDHLKAHGLDPAQGSVLPDVSFTLPPCKAPWLTLANDLAAAELPPKPNHWHIQAGWTRYAFMPDGSSYSEHVEYPEFDGKPEQMLVFDVETMPEHHDYAIMACAASKNAWYSWISPWLLGEDPDPQHLVPFGDPSVPRVVVGHNVSYDRKRVREEYNGISSHQRPAWMKYRKSKEKEQEQRQEAIEAVFDLMQQAEERLLSETDADKKAELERVMRTMKDSLSSMQVGLEPVEDDAEEAGESRWEALTSANSLADVAKLHCDITMDKDTRNDFMTSSREEILDGIHHYLDYCSSDVEVTHAVFAKVLPAFLSACPSPVSFAGVLTMGSSLLTVNEEWDAYIANAERTYRELDNKVKARLVGLAHEAKSMMGTERWKEDVWLGQLDWTPKVAGKSRGVVPPEVCPKPSDLESVQPVEHDATEAVPRWYNDLLADPFSRPVIYKILPLILRVSYEGNPLQYSTLHGWHYLSHGQATLLPSGKGKKVASVLSSTHGLQGFKAGRLSAYDKTLAEAICSGDRSDEVKNLILQLARATVRLPAEARSTDASLRQLDWAISDASSPKPKKSSSSQRKAAAPKPPPVLWPKWFWDLTSPKKDCPPGTLDVTIRNRMSPLLLRLSWQGWPLFHSREHGWTFRVPIKADFQTRAIPLSLTNPADASLHNATAHYTFYKLPHKDGEKANVGSPLGKTFMQYAQDGTLASPFPEAKDALDMNAQCSYWISARDRVMKQMVVWQDKGQGKGPDIGIPAPAEEGKKWGVILPQVITMGTVTRRAIEKTWLTASNAKKNRVGSELKAMVRAPPGYSIVGADVDSEELWISSVMGDAQFGLHGATAIGWMTLEGTKAAGTDLHSKTASILGISRDQAKVFNYSRIYGAGMRHAVLLLLQNSAGMLPERAQQLAENLYASTKGKNTHGTHLFGRKFWYGGTESFVFNKLEEIALSDRPQTPALGCGITNALSKDNLPTKFGSDYMPSRINWVVQSSGVDYLHLLIVSMDYLIAKYNIQARYLISVHDELRYLVKDEDRYRAALALQIANLWTRSLFAFKLGMDDLPQGVAFFSAVDIDRVLRKEVDMPCVTPSQPHPIPPGESLDIAQGGAPMVEDDGLHYGGSIYGYTVPDCLTHRARSEPWLRAQATVDLDEVRALAKMHKGPLTAAKRKKRDDSLTRLKKVRALGRGGDNVDWTRTLEQFMKALNA